MNIIQQNPFRILGLTGNSSEKELQKQIGIIKAFARVGKSKTFDYDFYFIGNLSRSQDDIQQAANEVEQAQKKLYFSLFWFVKENRIDETALNLLKNQNIDKAIEIWDKTLKDDVSNKNYTSYMNLSTLYIALSAITTEVDKQKLQQGILLKGKLINSVNLKDFSTLVTGNTTSGNSIEVNKKFIEEVIDILKPVLNKKNGISTKELISLFNSYPTNIQKYVSSKFTEIPVSNIENQIDKSAAKRKKHLDNANESGNDLFKQTATDIKFLKQILDKNNVQLQMIINKLANELIQCSIEYYNYYLDKKDGTDPGDNALDLAKKAQSIGATGQVKKRIFDNKKVMQAWVNDKPARERQEVVKTEFDHIEKMITQLSSQLKTIKNATNFLSNCKPQLNIIKSKLGENDSVYLTLSTTVVMIAQGMVVTVFNTAMDKRNKYVKYLNAQQTLGQFNYMNTQDMLRQIMGEGLNAPYAPAYSLPELKAVIGSAWKAIDSMKSMDMRSKEKQLYEKNKAGIKSIANQLQVPIGGCYIATMAYGDYNHQQVKELRNFRDDVLTNSILGRTFIKVYYKISPTLVNILKDQKRTNKVIRTILDRLIKYLRS